MARPVCILKPSAPRRSGRALEPMDTTFRQFEEAGSRRALLLPLLLFVVVVGIYFLSFGPILRYTGTTVTLAFTGGTVRPPGSGTVQGTTYPLWVRAIYHPVFRLLGTQISPSFGEHDPVNIYKEYLQWWRNRP
jgi:hypothetical protein